MLCNGQSDGTRQLVRIALNEVLEGLLDVELGVQLLRCGSIEHRRRLVGTSCRLSLKGHTVALHVNSHIVLCLHSHDTVTEPYAGTKHTGKHLA